MKGEPMKKILFISPKTSESGYNKFIAPLSLGTLASLTPAEKYDIRIIDEHHQKPDFDSCADLVCITSWTLNCLRAYNIATEFKKRNKNCKIIMGGMHPSACKEEALNYCDCVVVGEAESVWSKVLHDFEAGTLKKIYQEDFCSLENLPIPRRDLYPTKYVMESVYTSRGCPGACEFCSVTSYNGGRYRFRPINEVVKDIQSIKQKNLFIVDDNMYGYTKESIARNTELLKEMRHLGKKQLIQASINMADDKKALKYFSESGGEFILLGFESINEKTLKRMNKSINLKEGISSYKSKIKKVHDYGIQIIGYFISGYDDDDKSVFKNTLDFIYDTNIDIPSPCLLKPYPGTRLYERYKREKRLL
ncbi:B12-binding domain-containing radical SAM protein, partial [Candidatus Woesearchaeota archaeon]|nr:B12-binding domain-containing radical SAM protein [Candidatus Woesearchaeota archaeon]